jgi:hypothetical protein
MLTTAWILRDGTPAALSVNNFGVDFRSFKFL